MSIKTRSKNLFDGVSELGGYADTSGEKKTATKWRTGNFIKVVPNTTYSINSINKPSWATFTGLNVYEYDANKNWIRSEINVGWSIGGSFRIPSDVYYITLSSFGSIVTTQALAEEFGDTLVLVEGSTAPTSYIPYMTEVHELYKRTDNLFNKDTTTYHYYYNTSGQYLVAGSVSLSDWIEVEPNTTYVLSGISIGDSIARRINLFDSSKTWLSQPAVSSTYPFTVATTSNTRYIRFSFGQQSESVLDTNIMFVKGSTAPTEYVPYGLEYIEELYRYNPEISATEKIFDAGWETSVSGNPATLSNARAKDISYEVSGNIEKVIEIDGTEYLVPSGYTMADYISNSAAGAKVSTNITPSSLECEYYCKFYCNDTDSYYLMQSRLNSGIIWGLTGSSTNGTIAFSMNGTQVVSSITRTIGHTYEVKGSCSEGEMYLNVVDLTTGDEATNSGTVSAIGTPQAEISLFTNASSQSMQTGNRIYEAYYKEDGAYKFVLKPTIDSSNNIGMYDFISKTAMTTSGTFTAGNELPTPDQPLGYNEVGDKTRQYKPDDITKVGTPTITDAGIYTTANSNSFIKSSDTVPFSTASTWHFHWKFTYARSSIDQGIMSGNGNANVQSIINNTGKPRMSFGDGTTSGWFNGGIWNESSGSGTTLVSFNYVVGQTYENDIIFTGTEYQYWVDGVEIGYCTCSEKAADTYFAVGVERGRTSGQYSKCSWDLTDTYLTLDGVDYLDWNIECYKLPLLNASNCGCVDLGTLTWRYQSNYNVFSALISDIKNYDEIGTNLYCSNYATYSGVITSMPDKSVRGSYFSEPNGIAIKDVSFGTDATAFKNSLAGVYLYYQRTTDSSWTAPTIQNIYLSDPLMEIGSYTDSVNSDDEKVHKNVGKMILDGTESWIEDTAGRFYLSNIFGGLTSISGTVCSHFTVSNTNTHVLDMNIDYGGPTPRNMFVRYDMITDVNAFKAWLATEYENGTPVIVYYPLATETTTDVDCPTITCAKGLNYVECETSLKGDLDISFIKRNK